MKSLFLFLDISLLPQLLSTFIFPNSLPSQYLSFSQHKLTTQQQSNIKQWNQITRQEKSQNKLLNQKCGWRQNGLTGWPARGDTWRRMVRASNRVGSCKDRGSWLRHWRRRCVRRLWLMIFNVVTVVVGGFAMTYGQFESPSSFLFWFNFFMIFLF